MKKTAHSIDDSLMPYAGGSGAANAKEEMQSKARTDGIFTVNILHTYIKHLMATGPHVGLRKCAYMFFAVILLSFLAYSILHQKSAIIEILIAISCLTVIYYFDWRYGLSVEAVILLSAGALLNPLGIFGLYSYFILSGFVGYDKVIPFFSAFAIAYGILDMQKSRNPLTYAASILIVMGLGSLIEITEFIGEIYFDVDTGGIFAMTDTLPEMKSDLQKYDTYYDMIFNLVGAACGSLAAHIKAGLKTNVSR
jgi:hypothetical protein